MAVSPISGASFNPETPLGGIGRQNSAEGFELHLQTKVFAYPID